MLQGWLWGAGGVILLAALILGGWIQRRRAAIPSSAPELPVEQPLACNPADTAQSELIESLQLQVEELRGQLAEATVERQSHNDHTSALQSQLQDAQEESELLLLQLHQVQEELEHYFLLSQSLEQQQQQQQPAPVVTPEPVPAVSAADLAALRQRLAALLERRQSKDQRLHQLLQHQQRLLLRASAAIGRAQGSLKPSAQANGGEVVFL